MKTIIAIAIGFSIARVLYSRYDAKEQQQLKMEIKRLKQLQNT